MIVIQKNTLLSENKMVKYCDELNNSMLIKLNKDASEITVKIRFNKRWHNAVGIEIPAIKLVYPSNSNDSGIFFDFQYNKNSVNTDDNSAILDEIESFIQNDMQEYVDIISRWIKTDGIMSFFNRILDNSLERENMASKYAFKKFLSDTDEENAEGRKILNGIMSSDGEEAAFKVFKEADAVSWFEVFSKMPELAEIITLMCQSNQQTN